jgi:hypothetical protein
MCDSGLNNTGRHEFLFMLRGINRLLKKSAHEAQYG